MGHDKVFGYLLTIDIYGVEPSKCQDLNLGYGFLDKLPDHIGMHKQSLPHIYVTPSEWIGKGGLSGWVGLIESGIQLHTLTDKGFVSIDLYTCSYIDHALVPGVLEFVKKYYPYEFSETNLIERGLEYYNPERDTQCTRKVYPISQNSSHWT
ncbi:MAG: S-adenosylmethionine decarboxylase [Deltaproteobacteria bacterium]|nr:S-adenosylmethionine decarboxylase [Deltaproteobacteria bacterium]